MKVYELILPEDFKNIKKNDLLIVEFQKAIYPLKDKIDAFRVYLNKLEDDEIILNKKYNIYFNWKMYLNGSSHVEKVYLVSNEN